MAEVRGTPAAGEITDVVSSDGEFLGRGYYNPQSRIAVRVLTWRDEPVDREWWIGRLRRAIESRRHGTAGDDDGDARAERLVNAEGDRLPGLIVDRYGPWIVLQALTLGIERRKLLLAELLRELLSPRGVYERSDVPARDREGLERRAGVLLGETPPPRVAIKEHGLELLVDVRRGHKTGAYLDQRGNRLLVQEHVRRHPRRESLTVLNLFSYSGSFGLHALYAGAARVVSVDSSREALELGEECLRHARLPEDRCELIEGNVFELARDYAAASRLHDVVVLDPPKFAHGRGQVARAARGYKDVNLHALRCVEPGGLLMTFSCSAAIDPELFGKIVSGALVDSGREAQVLARLQAAPDHPVALTCPEGAYLKGLLLRVH